MEIEKVKHPIVGITGLLEEGKQFDLDIKLPADRRNVIYGVIRDCYNEPIEDAVVKLIEVDCKHGKEERKPVSHTFTDEFGQFVFGPLCENKFYEIAVWVNRVRHVKICAKCKHEGKCLKGIDIDKCDCVMDCDNFKCPDKCDDKHDNEKCHDKEHECECK